jgi:hypothetical protein
VFAGEHYCTRYPRAIHRPLAVTSLSMMPPRPPLTVIKLSDHFGQYVLTLKCECGHTRTARPRTLAAPPANDWRHTRFAVGVTGAILMY